MWAQNPTLGPAFRVPLQVREVYQGTHCTACKVGNSAMANTHDLIAHSDVSQVDVPGVAVTHKCCAFLAVLMSLLPLYMNDAWALTEAPGGVVNAWSDVGSMETANSAAGQPNRTNYCSNDEYTYVNGRHDLPRPECQALRPTELTLKTAKSIAFATSIIERTTTGWPCAIDANQSRWRECAQRRGLTTRRRNGQCICEIRRAIYPLQVEQMLMKFEHAYIVSGNWRGSSASSLDAGEGLWSELHYPNGTSLRFGAGEALEMTLADWLTAANVSLGEPNEAVGIDDGGRQAPRRSTGVQIRVDVSYSNIDPATGKAVIAKRSVHADVRLRSEYSTWTEMERETTWLRMPSMPRKHPSEFHLVEREKHGVQFRFHISGAVYRFNFFVALQVVLSAVVLIQIAAVVADGISFYGLPGGQSTVLRNKREELVSKRSEYAEIGMKAALAALRYRDFDPDGNGSIEPLDIVRAFAHVVKADGSPWVTWDKAHAIAHSVLADADTDVDKEGGDLGLSFSEFVTCLHGESMDFDSFLRHLEMPADATDAEECRLAFEEERAALPAIVKKKCAADQLPLLPPPIKHTLSGQEQQTRLSASGTIRIHLMHVNGLQLIDGKFSLICLVEFGKKQQRSSVKECVNGAVWDEIIEFPNVASLEKAITASASGHVALSFKDKDGSDVGRVSVRLDTLADYDRANCTESIEPQGTVLFSVHWMRGGNDGAPKSLPKTKRTKPKTQASPADESTTAES